MLIKKPPTKIAIQKNVVLFKIKMKNLLKITKQPVKTVPRIEPCKHKIIKQAKYLRKTHKGANFYQYGRHTACRFTGNEPPMKVPKVYFKIE